MTDKSVIIPGKRYRTINACLAAFFDCKVKDLDALEGNFVTRTAEGKNVSVPVQKAIKIYRKVRVWGWVESKEFIHYFVRKSATMLDLVTFFAHEVGHMQRPWHRSLKEEQKAEKYAKVAGAALQLAQQVYQEVRE